MKTYNFTIAIRGAWHKLNDLSDNMLVTGQGLGQTFIRVKQVGIDLIDSLSRVLRAMLARDLYVMNIAVLTLGDEE